MSSFFKKLGKDISSPFKKGGVINKAFAKGSGLARGAADFVKKVGDIGDKIVKSPITKAIAEGLAPVTGGESLTALSGARALLGQRKGLEKGIRSIAKTTDPNSYKGSVKDVLGQVKANVMNTAEQLQKPMKAEVAQTFM